MIEAGGSDLADRLPWPIMVVDGTGPVRVSPQLRELLSLDAASLDEVTRRFELAHIGGRAFDEEELPWRRAARGESFTDEEIWYDRRTTERLLLHVRCRVQDGLAIIGFENLAEQPYQLQRAELAGSIAAALLRAEDQAGVAHAIVEDVARALGAEAVFLLAAEPRQERLALLASVGVPAAFVQEHRSLSLDMPTILAISARTQTLQQVDDIASLPARGYSGTRELLDLGLRSTVALPLMADGELVGVLGLAWRHPGRLNKLERRTLQGVSAACALGLRHARLRAAERREAERLRTLREAAIAIGSALPLRDLLRRLVEQACELTHARYGALGVLDPKGHGLSDFVYVGVPREVADQIGHLPEGRGLLGAVIAAEHPIRVAEIGRDPRSSGFPAHHPAMTSFLGLPLRIGHEVFGNFYVCDKDGGAAFTEEDERLLELFAAQSALAVGYAREEQVAEEAHRQVERLRDEFAAVIAHDLRSPVAAMLMHVEGLLGQAGAAQTVSAPTAVLESLRRIGYRITQMTAELLNVSRIELGRLDLDRRAVSPAPAVEALLAQLAPTLGGHPVTLDVQGAPQPVLVDPARLDEILTNLLENAAKYSGPDAPIRVIVEPASGGTIITVEDRGGGIAPEDLPRLFDRFYQAPRARAKKTGLGLGLYVAKGLVEAQGGRIWVDSQPGQGSRFHVWMPSASPPGAEASQATL